MKIKKEFIPYGIGGLAFVCSFIGYLLLEDIHVIKAFYKTFGLFGGNADLEDINAWILLASLCAPIAVTSAIAFFFLETLKERWFFWQKAHGHCVVVGLGNMGLTLVNDILEHKKNDIAPLLVVIESDKNNPHIQELKDRGVIVLIGDATRPSILAKAKISRANKVICLTGKDLSNLEVAIQIARLEATCKPSMYVHLNHRENNELLKSDLFRGVNIKSFSVYDNAAQTLFMRFPIGHNVDTLHPHNLVKLAIVGFDAVGESLVYRALNLGHFYNQRPIEITIFDEDHLNKQKEFEKRYPMVKAYEGMYWKVCFKEESELYTDETLPYSQLIFCSKESEHTYADAMRLMRNNVKQIHERGSEIYFFSDIYEEIASLIDAENRSTFEHLHAFGALKKMCSYDVIVNERLDTMARKSHEGYNALHNYPDPWESLDAFLKESNRMQVEHLQIKLPIITHYLNENKVCAVSEELKEDAKRKWFIYGGEMTWDTIEGAKELLGRVPLDVLDTLARIEHTRWNAFHLLNGWKLLTSLGSERKDKQLKLHTCLVAWDELDLVSKHFSHDYKSDDVETVLRAQHMTSFVEENETRCAMKHLIEAFRRAFKRDG